MHEIIDISIREEVLVMNSTLRQKTTSFAASVALMAGLAGCGTAAASQSSSTSASASSLTPVVIDQAFQSLLYLPLYVAIDKGFFTQHGLSVKKVTAGSGSNGVSAVISGSAQFSLQDPMIAVLADIKGANVRPVAAVINGVPTWVVGKSAATGISALRGQTISTAIPPSTGTYLVERLLKENHITAHLRFVKLGTELSPVLAGQASAATLAEPTVEQALSSGYHVEYSFAKQYAGDYAYSSIDANESFIKSHPQTVQRFVDGIQQAEQYMTKHPRGTIKVAEKEFPGLSQATVAKAVTHMVHSNVYASNALITQSAYDHAIALQKYLGKIKTNQAPYASEVVRTFAEKAVGH